MVQTPAIVRSVLIPIAGNCIICRQSSVPSQFSRSTITAAAVGASPFCSCGITICSASIVYSINRIQRTGRVSLKKRTIDSIEIFLHVRTMVVPFNSSRKIPKRSCCTSSELRGRKAFCCCSVDRKNRLLLFCLIVFRCKDNCCSIDLLR